MKSDSLGDRMKGYESAFKHSLVNRTPVIIRIDGKAFHTWTKQLNVLDGELEHDPFSSVMNSAMLRTTKALVHNVQNAVLGYTQSDEISILLNDWKTLETDQWFGNNIQKIASVSASIATAHYNAAIRYILNEYPAGSEFTDAMFDARVFNLPKEEVVNYFVWRQQDATRNSVQMLGRHYFSHKEMHKKNVSDIQDMLMEKHSINWNDCDTWKKRGSCVVHKMNEGVSIDKEIPIFTQDRTYIEELLKENNT